MELPGSGHFAVGNPVDDTVQKNDSQPPPYSTERAIAKMGCCTWHYAILIVGFVLFFIDMWLPFWTEQEVGGGCFIYSGAFGRYVWDCSTLYLHTPLISEYYLISSGTCRSNNLYDVSGSGFDCEAAALALALADTNAEVSGFTDRPPGCIYNSESDILRFNSYNTGTSCGSGEYNYACICEEPVVDLRGLADGWTAYEAEEVDSDTETIQGGVTVAFLFGLGAVIAKGCAWKADPPAKNALIASAILTSIAILGAVISWGKFADIVDAEYLFLCFALQLIASFMVVASVVMDVKAVGSYTV